MGKLLAGIIIGGLSVYAYQRAQQTQPEVLVHNYTPQQAPAPATLPAVESDNSRFRCDGRTYCSQMTSCEEATFFLKNCPGVKVDGEGDGVPCEKQWCSSH